ncbi:hypothetical protein [Mesorhizobium sp. AR07]|uniref:hypothetical protein n=1 Tax=Mesorhizobium sp. AR07 TaxID=2865838 RepID=UPI00215FBF5C|nr:hypothetical protein [Mesorhizobium sp. AR07]
MIPQAMTRSRHSDRIAVFLDSNGTSLTDFRCSRANLAVEGGATMKLLRTAPIAILACALALSACANTVRGVGKDVKSTARAVDETVEKP